MKAIVCTKYGPPTVLQAKEVDKPTPKDDQVLIRVRATTVTSGDVRLRKADPFLIRLFFGLLKPRKPILGSDLAGEVEAVGKGVRRFKPGDRVFGLGGRTYAEYTCLTEKGPRALKPTNTSFEEAAAIPWGAGCSLYFLRRGGIRAGQRVLIYGASGSLGTAAVQLAKYLGAEVTAVCSTTNLELVKSLGADKVIDYTREDSISSGELYDFILDAVGRRKSSKLQLQCKNALAQGGKYVSVDGGMPWPRAEYLVRLRQMIEEGRFRAVIDRCYPLEQIVEAHRYVDKGHKKGNVVIAVGHSNKT